MRREKVCVTEWLIVTCRRSCLHWKNATFDTLMPGRRYPALRLSLSLRICDMSSCGLDAQLYRSSTSLLSGDPCTRPYNLACHHWSLTEWYSPVWYIWWLWSCHRCSNSQLSWFVSCQTALQKCFVITAHRDCLKQVMHKPIISAAWHWYYVTVYALCCRQTQRLYGNVVNHCATFM